MTNPSNDRPNDVPQSVENAVLQPSVDLASDPRFAKMTVEGFDFNAFTGSGNDYSRLLCDFYTRTGFQATCLGQSIELVNEMINWRLSDEPVTENESEEYLDPEVRQRTKCKIFLGYTSNIVSSGLRDIIRFLCQHRMVDVVVSTAGGIEEDFVKCLAPTFVLGEFRANGAQLRRQGLNRIGNLVVPNDNYCRFEDWVMPILDQMLLEQQRDGTKWTPSRVIWRLGKEINDERSIYYWCYRNQIPVYCPALTDGSLGDMIYFHSFRNPGLVIDLVEDIRAINNEAVYARRTGMIILGGGLVKHHICNANLMRNGADYALYINTGQEFDGSDSGAHPDEAVSWGKIRSTARPVKLCADATLVFPLIVAETFARHQSVNKGK